jgi:hypothetical protein
MRVKLRKIINWTALKKKSLSPFARFSALSELLMKSEVSKKKGDSEKQLNFVTLRLAQSC